MNYINFTLIGVIGLLLIGFLIGFIRNWKKSLTRFIILLACLLVSMFLAPVISHIILSQSIDGTRLKLFSLDIDFSKIIADLLNKPELANDLVGANATTNQLISAIIRVAANLAVFLALFIVLYLISLLIYAIVFAVLSSKRKKKGIKVEKNGKYWGLKFLSGFIGLVSMMVIAFVFMIPAFGVLKICSNFETDEGSDPKANAYSLKALMGEKFYESNSNDGMDAYIKQIVEVKKEYDSSALGKVLNALGISKAGEGAFSFLTTVTVVSEEGSLKFNLTNEISSIIEVVNIYDSELKNKEFDVTDNNYLDSVLKIYDAATKSEVVKSYLVELLPKLSEKWSAGKEFLGISAPKGEYREIIIDALEIFDTKDIEVVTDNVKTLIGSIQYANNKKFIEALNEKDGIEEFLSKDKTFVEQFILKLTTTNELKQALPDILNDFMSIVYKNIFKDSDKTLAIDKTQNYTNIDWNKEAKRMQSIMSTLFTVNSNMKSGVETYSVLDDLTNIGRILDDAKNSEILSKTFYQFMHDFLSDKEKVKLEDKVRTSILGAFGELDDENSNWNNKNFSYEKVFGTIYDTIKFAEKVKEDFASGNLSELEDVLKKAVDDGSIKDVLKDMLDSGIVNSFVENDKTGMAQTITDIVDKMLDNENSNNLENDIEVGQTLLDILNHKKEEGNFFADKDATDDFLDAIEGSMVGDYLKEQAAAEEKDQNKALSDAAKNNLSEADKELLQQSLDSKYNDPQDEEEQKLKEALKKYFGL